MKRTYLNALPTTSRPSNRRPVTGPRRLFGLRTVPMAALVCILMGIASLPAQAQNPCGTVWQKRHVGPYDYRSASRALVQEVENAHFTPDVEALRRGKTNSYVGPDLAYTLRAIPNHHRALVSAVGLSRKFNTPQPRGMEHPIECYFIRALEFKRDDLVVYALYADWLAKSGRKSEAEEHLATAEKLSADNPIGIYSLGLLHLEMGNAEKALSLAYRALELGWPQQELANRLRAAGLWREPAPAAAPAPGASSPAAEKP